MNITIGANPRVNHDFDVIEHVEAGIVLSGQDVKNLRGPRPGTVLRGCFATIDGGSVTLHGLKLSGGHVPAQDYRLLLHRREIARLFHQMRDSDRITLVPRRIYWNADGRVKIELCLARGRRAYDKRQVERARTADREARQEM